jgi:hypothetical protein
MSCVSIKATRRNWTFRSAIYRRAKCERVWLGEARSDCSLIDTLFLEELGPCGEDPGSVLKTGMDNIRALLKTNSRAQRGLQAFTGDLLAY